jgi:hypothetical protein
MLAPLLIIVTLAAASPPRGDEAPPDPRDASAPLAGPALRALDAAGAGEPAIAEVREAAAREAERAGADPVGFARRARLAALLPRLTAEYRRDERSDRIVGLQGSGEVDYLKLAPGSAYLVRATWDLGDLVAAREELAAASAGAARAARREAAMKRATALFFERRRARVSLLLAPPASPQQRAEAELEIERLTAELDAATGGLLTRRARP